MSRPDDRVAVPTNGHGGPLAGVGDASLQPAAAPGAPLQAAGGTTGPADEGVATRRNIAIEVTPTQLAVGFGVIASLILLLLGRRRGRRG
jgi:hypothetical protein